MSDEPKPHGQKMLEQLAGINAPSDTDASAAVGPLLPVGFVPRCPICGTQVWERRLPEDLRPDESFQEAVVGVRDSRLQTLRAVHFICSNCGFVRTHIADKLKEPGQ